MNFDYNRIFLENRQLTNKTVLVWMNLMAGLVVFLWAFSLMHLISVGTWSFLFVAPLSAFLFILPSICNKLFHLSDVSSFDGKGIHILTTVLQFCSLIGIFALSCSLSYQITLAWFFPMLISCQYYSKKMTERTFIASLIGILASNYLSLYIGLWDYNFFGYQTGSIIRDLSFATISRATLYVLPKIILFCAAFPLFYGITKRTELLLKKQHLSIMANEAKKTLYELQEFPDTFTTDCKIKMRYLSKNNIDVDTALQNMDGNVEKYNDFVLTFVGESHRKEDELFNLMDADSLLQYGAKVHALRVKANTLGLKNLTDTAFFHEMEAYAGNLEIVQANWEKLSFEWDEACDLFTDYITSLGLKNHASDGKGHQITFQEWGNQLNEAFQALEVYDTTRARNILNELLKYQIDTDITKNLELIVANIDDILKA